MELLWVLVVVLLVLWLIGWLGPTYYSGLPRTGGVIHTLLVIALILILLSVLGII
jgi:hypothetical protein